MRTRGGIMFFCHENSLHPSVGSVTDSWRHQPPHALHVNTRRRAAYWLIWLVAGQGQRQTSKKFVTAGKDQHTTVRALGGDWQRLRYPGRGSVLSAVVVIALTHRRSCGVNPRGESPAGESTPAVSDGLRRQSGYHSRLIEQSR